MLARAGDSSKQRESRVFRLFHIAAHEPSHRSAKIEALLIAAQQTKQSADVPAIIELFSIVERKLVARLAAAFGLSAERGIDRGSE